MKLFRWKQHKDENLNSEARRWCARHAGVVAFVLLLFAREGLHSAPMPELVIRHVNVIDVVAAQVHADQRVTVQAGRIAAIEQEQSAPPRAAKVLDASGKFLIPGLWDMHAHLILPEWQTVAEAAELALPVYLANGVLGLREMGAWDVDVAPLVRLRDEIAAGNRLGPNLYVTGTRIFDVSPAEARQTVRDLKAAGADFVKVYSDTSKETYLAVVDECKRAGLPFAGHIPQALTVREAIEAGQRSIEHMGNGMLQDWCFGYFPENAPPSAATEPQRIARLKEALNAAIAGQPPDEVWGESTRAVLDTPEFKTQMERLHKQLGLIEALQVLYCGPDPDDAKLVVRAKHTKEETTYTFHLIQQGKIEWAQNELELQPDKVRQLAEWLSAHQTWLTPTLLVHRNAAARRELVKTPDPRHAYLPPKVRRQFDPENDDRLRDLTGDDIAEFKRSNARDAQLVALLHKAGVGVLAGTDEYFLPGFGLHEELALLVQAGLTPIEALRTATLNPAEFLGRENDFGSVAVGKRADLVLLEQNPLIDIRNTASIWGVIRAGKYFDRAALDQMLNSVRKRVRQLEHAAHSVSTMK